MTELLPDVAGVRALGADFPVPLERRWFEHYRPGAVYEYGYAGLSAEQIRAFAVQFDPQPMHTDAGAAASGPFGGLIASGWHTACLFMRLYVDHYLSRVAGLASPGLDELRWPAPLRPDEQIRLRATVLEARPSRSKPDRGAVTTRGELVTESGSVVLTLTAINLLLRRPPATQ